MLTQRTNVLLSPEEHAMLVSLSKEHNKTMGELIRQAVKKTYRAKRGDSFEESLLRIRRLTKSVKIKRSEYRSLVVDGRKYDD